MKRHSFNQTEVLMLEGKVGKRFKDAMWDKFKSTANELGFNIRITGGNFLTHEIDGDEDDFIAIQLLAIGK